jgi:signal transduction histidine kinase
MQQRLLHALDLGMLGDWDGAKRSLENLDDPLVARLAMFFTEQQRLQRQRADVQAVVRHELGNAIAIAQVNMEALVDGVLQPTPERLKSIRDAMIACGALLDDLKKEYRGERVTELRVAQFDMCDVIAAQIALVSGIAESKNVAVHNERCGRNLPACRQYTGDPERVALILRDILLGAVRYTPPGGSINIGCVQPDGEIELSVSADARQNGETLALSLGSKLLDSIGGHARVVAEHTDRTIFAVQLPATQKS